MSDITPPPVPPATPGAPPPAETRTTKGLGTGALLAIVGGGVLLVVIVIGVIMTLVITQGRTPGGTAAPGAGQGAEMGPAAVTEAFLTAVAAGDSATALSYLQTAPTDDTLLTDEALAASLALAPITDIEVTEPAEADFSTEVSARYSLGGTPVTVDFRLNEYDSDGIWKVGNGVAEIDLARFDGLDMAFNGQTVGSTAEVFPGTYELTTTTPDFALSGATTLTIRSGSEFPDFSDLEVTLSETGLTTYRSIVQDAAATCLASKQLVAGCGLDLPETLSDGSRPVDGTITRTLTPEGQAELDSLEPRIDYGSPLQVRGDYIGTVEVTAEFDVDGSRVSGDLLFGPSLGSPFVDFSSGEPVLTWD